MRIRPNLCDVSGASAAADVYRESSVNDVCETRAPATRTHGSGATADVTVGGWATLNVPD
jgi:hypothetical protein